jgi:signal peptidase I
MEGSASYAPCVIDEQLERGTSAAGRIRRGSFWKARRGSFWKEMPILLVVAIVVAICIRAFVLQTFFIPSSSMEHTLNINDRILVNKLVYHFRSPGRGEIIVFTSPDSWRNTPDEKDFIKRVIGIGGDHVACCDADERLTVNGAAINEPYLNSDAGTMPASPTKFTVVVPKGRLWVMGDNRFFSGDSQERYAVTGNIDDSTIATSAVIGRAFVVFWPLGRATWLTVPPGFSQVGSPAPG